MDREMENTLFLGCYVGAAFCVALAYNVGRHGKQQLAHEQFERGKHYMKSLYDLDQSASPSGSDNGE